MMLDDNFADSTLDMERAHFTAGLADHFTFCAGTPFWVGRCSDFSSDLSISCFMKIRCDNAYPPIK